MLPRPSVTLVVMAGGRGERLWPLVRVSTPKVCLAPDGKHSLLHATVERLRGVWPGASWLIVTTQGQARAVRASLPRSLRSAVLVEPQVKNTAACITLAAASLALADPHRVMIVVPADHWIGDLSAFRQAGRAAIQGALAYDTIATIGIRPSHPHLGLGYLCADSPLGGSRRPRVFRLARFIEKPSAALTKRLIKRPRTYWNSGMFIGTAEKFLESITRWLPDHAHQVVPLATYLGTTQFPQRARRVYRTLEAVSFDCGVMHRLQGGVVVEGQFQWADLGSWDAWARLTRSSSSVVNVESRDVTVVSQARHVVATIGVRNLLIVQTPSATLVCPTSKAQAVREIVRRLSLRPELAAYL